MAQQIYYYIFFIMIFMLILLHCYKIYFFNINASNKLAEGFQENFKEGIKFPKLNDIKKGIIGPLKPMIDFFKKLPKKITETTKGFRGIFGGIEDQFKFITKGLTKGFTDIGLLIAYASEFVFTYTVCSVKYISNIPNCIFYYLVDIFIQIMYLPIRITIWILYAFIGINLYPTQNMIWKFLEQINGYVYGFIGFNIIRWPKNIRDQCYNCKRLKTSVLVDKASDINKGFKSAIPSIFDNKHTKNIKRYITQVFGGGKIKKITPKEFGMKLLGAVKFVKSTALFAPKIIAKTIAHQSGHGDVNRQIDKYA